MYYVMKTSLGEKKDQFLYVKLLKEGRLVYGQLTKLPRAPFSNSHRHLAWSLQVIMQCPDSIRNMVHVNELQRAEDSSEEK